MKVICNQEMAILLIRHIARMLAKQIAGGHKLRVQWQQAKRASNKPLAPSGPKRR